MFVVFYIKRSSPLISAGVLNSDGLFLLSVCSSFVEKC